MKSISVALNKCLRYRFFRLFLARVYPIILKTNILKGLQKLNRGSFSDAWEHIKDYDSLDKKYLIDFNKFIIQKKNYIFAFLTKLSEIDSDEILNACKILGVKCLFYDICDPLLFEKLKRCECDGIFIYPVFNTNLIRNLFHEAAQILSSETKLKIYPTIRELNIYESKRNLANFLAVNDIPHPSTSILYDLPTAMEYITKSRFPKIFKTHIGASSSGVEILRNQKQAIRLARQIFNKYYLRKLEIEKRNTEWGYMILQEYIEDVKEFRIIKVGDSWFGYQKWKNEDQDFMSGSGVEKMINPSEDLLNFCHEIAEKYNFTTMSFDIFKNNTGEYLVNELQTWFGSYDPTEMYVNNVPGRYRLIEGKWIFEPGFYNIYGSNLLRLSHFISLLQN